MQERVVMRGSPDAGALVVARLGNVVSRCYTDLILKAGLMTKLEDYSYGYVGQMR